MRIHIGRVVQVYVCVEVKQVIVDRKQTKCVITSNRIIGNMNSNSRKHISGRTSKVISIRTIVSGSRRTRIRRLIITTYKKYTPKNLSEQ